MIASADELEVKIAEHRTAVEAVEGEKNKWSTERASLEASLRDEKLQAFILRNDNRTDLGIIEDSRKKLMAAEAEEKKSKEEIELANLEINNLKEDVVVLTRAIEELKVSPKKAEKDLSVAKKGGEKSKDPCKTAQQLEYSFRTNHRTSNTDVSSDQSKVVASLTS